MFIRIYKLHRRQIAHLKPLECKQVIKVGVDSLAFGAAI